MYRDHTKVIQIGDRKIGGGNPILIQSMTNTKTEDVKATVAQILALEQAGCDIIRCAVPTMEAAQAAYDEGQAMLDTLNAQYDDIISWADMYDSASMESKKMIVSCLIRRVEV